MAFLPDPLSALVRGFHVTASIVWLGALWMSTWLDVRVYPRLGRGAGTMVGGQLAGLFIPLFRWGAVATFAFGILLYVDVASRVTLANVAWAVHAGAVLALLVMAILEAKVIPAKQQVHKHFAGDGPAYGDEANAPALHAKRGARWSGVASGLSVLAIVLMVGATQLGGFFR